MQRIAGPQPTTQDTAERPWLATVCAALLAVSPAAALLDDSAAGTILHVLAFTGLVSIGLHLRPDRRAELRGFWREYSVFCLALATPLAVNLLSQISTTGWDQAFTTVAQRLALAGLVLFAALRATPEQLKRFQWGVVLGIVLAVATLYVDSQGGQVRPQPSSLNLLNFTHLLILLGLFSLCALNWHATAYPRTEAALKIGAFLLMLYGAVLAESRGPLLSLAALLALYFIFCVQRLNRRARFTATLALSLLLLAGVASSSDFRARLSGGLDTTRHSLSALLGGNASPDSADASIADTSTGIRFELWRASWLMFQQHSWAGDGGRPFGDRLAELNRAGLVHDAATWEDGGEPYTQPHNEIANALATRGLVGLATLLTVYLVPLYYFLKRRRSPDPLSRAAANMGMLTCVGAMLFGLTVSLFTSALTTSFYVLAMATFLSMSRPRASQARRVPSRPRPFPAPWAMTWLRKLYKVTHRRAYRHNVHLWPYVDIQRDASGRIIQYSVQGAPVPLIPADSALPAGRHAYHVFLSGPSVADIDYSRLPALCGMGVNGSIALQDRYDIDFPYYCIIDSSFAQARPDIIERVVSTDRLLFATPGVLRYVYQHVPAHNIHCRFSVIEHIAEPSYAAAPTARQLLAMRRHGRDIHVFDANAPLGYSFDPVAGWFDADTVAYAVLQLLVWNGARTVYFHGLDILGATSCPRFYESHDNKMESRLERHFPTLIEPSFKQAMPLLSARGIQVYNLSPRSAIARDIIPYKDWRDFIVR